MTGSIEQIVDRVGEDTLGDADVVVGPRLFAPRILADVEVDGCYLVEVASLACGLLRTWLRTVAGFGFTPDVSECEKPDVLESLYCFSLFCPLAQLGSYCQEEPSQVGEWLSPYQPQAGHSNHFDDGVGWLEGMHSP